MISIQICLLYLTTPLLKKRCVFNFCVKCSLFYRDSWIQWRAEPMGIRWGETKPYQVWLESIRFSWYENVEPWKYLVMNQKTRYFSLRPPLLIIYQPDAYWLLNNKRPVNASLTFLEIFARLLHLQGYDEKSTTEKAGEFGTKQCGTKWILQSSPTSDVSLRIGNDHVFLGLYYNITLYKIFIYCGEDQRHQILEDDWCYLLCLSNGLLSSDS